jgi:hypothetical protein
MILLPEFQVTATSNVKDGYTKTTSVARTDNTFTATTSGVNLVKAILPADATLLDVNVYSAVGSNAGTSASLYVGAVLPFSSISAAGTTATVVCPVYHNLTTGDLIVVNGTGQANFDKATPVAITVTTSTQFTYTISSTTATSTVGDIGVCNYFVKQPLSVLNNSQVTVAVGASPFAYTAPAIGSVIISGGTVSAITLTHAGGTPVNIGVVAGVIPVLASDVVTVTYTVAPTMTFIPHDKSTSGILQSLTNHALNTQSGISSGGNGGLSVGWVNATTGTAGVPMGMDVQIFGLYQETGTTSSSGGPWFLTFWYVR